MREYHFVIGDTPYVILAATLREALTQLRALSRNES